MSQKVLVFESDATFAGELRNELTKLGCAVQVVDDGNAGLQQASSAKPDLILLSIELPRMNGFSVCNKLKKDPSLKDVPLIIMSSESSDETFEQHRKLRTRAEDYVHKPITFGDLLARIQPFVVLGDGAGAGADEDHPTGHPPASPGAPQVEMAAESVDGEDILIEEMPSRPPPARSRPAPEDHANGNGTASLDNALHAESAPDEPASEPPPPVRRSERPRSIPPSPDLTALQSKVRSLEDALVAAQRDAATAREEVAAASVKAASTPVDADELARLEKENADLKQRLSASTTGAKPGGVSSREFLDLREALNKKDKEILSLKEGLAKKDKEIVDVREKSLTFERGKADLEDKVLEHERSLAEQEDKLVSLQADKDQAKKAGDDFKRRSERSQQETEVAKRELAEAREKQTADLAAKDAEIAKLHEEHAAAIDAEKSARAQALSEAEEKRTQDLAAAEAAKVTALEEAQQAADDAQMQALTARANALETAHQAKTAELGSAHEQALEALRGEHADASAAQAKKHEEETAAHAETHAGALAALRSELEADRDAKVARAEQDRDTKLSEAEARAAAAIEAAQSEASSKVATAESNAAAKVASVESNAAAEKASADAQIAELASNLGTTKSSLSDVETKASELEAALAATNTAKAGVEKELETAREKLASLDADLAATRQSLTETKGHLVTQTNRLEKASAKIEADKTSLDRAKDALAVALQQIEEAESRTA